MARSKHLFVLLLSLVVLAVVIIQLLKYRLVIKNDHETFEYLTDFNDGLPPKTFLYLIQTERCIPNYFLSMDVLGDELMCDCRIIVLSFKSKCLVNPPPHVKYISSNTSTTFTDGRSLLYTTAISRPVDYLYYIFLDDDVILHTKDINDNIDPWRWFESFLKKIQPPLAVFDNPAWHLIDRIQQRRLEQRDCFLDSSLTYEYFPVIFFDAMANAFHGKAIRHILGPVLPYWNKLDDISWWFSQWYINMMTDVAFHGQAVLLRRVMTRNDVHRPYNRKLHDAFVLQSIADDIRKVVPERYTTVTDRLLKTWVANYEDVLNTVRDIYCKEPPPPNPDILPFGWAEGS